mgnify:CR=1 FL=1
MKVDKSNVLYFVGLICAIWFALTGWLWLYWGALIIAYPFGLIAFIIWLVLRKKDEKRADWLYMILLLGFGVSLMALSMYK